MNYDAWAEWYDVIYASRRVDEVEFYVQLARQSGGPVLEVGVGTGRIAIPSAQCGIEVVGVDANQPMLDAAARKVADAELGSGSLELVVADMRTFDLGRQFALVTAPSRTLLLATTQHEQRAAINRFAAHVTPGGLLAFNVFAPDPGLIADDESTEFLWGESTNPANGRRCLLWAVNRFDQTTQTNNGLQIVEELDERGCTARKVTLDVIIRYLYPAEIHEMVEESELAIENVYGDFDRAEFDEYSEEMIFICRKPA